MKISERLAQHKAHIKSMRLSDRLSQHKADMRSKGWLLPGEDKIPSGVPIKTCSPALLIWIKPV